MHELLNGRTPETGQLITVGGNFGEHRLGKQLANMAEKLKQFYLRVYLHGACFF